MTLYETIFARRSVRKYEDAPLTDAALADVMKRAGGAKQLFGQAARFELARKDELKGGQAPYAVLAYGGGDDAARVNIGYVLQGIDLYVQSVGYGSVWCGMARPKEPKPDYRILLGFGNASVPLRSGEAEFKRAGLTDIADEDNAVARAARLAPSAVNFQPWRLTFSEGKVIAAANVRGIGGLLPGKLYLYDLGIITKHVEIALEHEGFTVTDVKLAGSGKELTVEVDYAR
ncbi:MAG: hypothetical protein LBP79_02365 [Clostridiales bacterium]|jgi:nitroreductase|nr:hypothetical protein [Clostridiales bacterium]